MTKTAKINAARAFGSIAFANGVHAAPSADANLMDLLAGEPVGGSGVKIMQAWLAGWTQANLAA